MSYTPTEWNTGDTITASALNKIENGIANAGGGGALIVTTSDIGGETVMDKTVQEIHDALMSGTPVYYKFEYGTLGVDYVSHSWLAPITYVYAYAETDVIRVVVQRPFRLDATATGSVSVSSGYVPGVMLFQASGLNEYPKFYRTIYTTNQTTMATDYFY